MQESSASSTQLQEASQQAARRDVLRPAARDAPVGKPSRLNRQQLMPARAPANPLESAQSWTRVALGSFCRHSVPGFQHLVGLSKGQTTPGASQAARLLPGPGRRVRCAARGSASTKKAPNPSDYRWTGGPWLWEAPKPLKFLCLLVVVEMEQKEGSGFK